VIPSLYNAETSRFIYGTRLVGDLKGDYSMVNTIVLASGIVLCVITRLITLESTRIEG